MYILYNTVFLDYTHIVVGMMFSVRPHIAVPRSSLQIYARLGRSDDLFHGTFQTTLRGIPLEDRHEPLHASWFTPETVH